MEKIWATLLCCSLSFFNNFGRKWETWSSSCLFFFSACLLLPPQVQFAKLVRPSYLLGNVVWVGGLINFLVIDCDSSSAFCSLAEFCGCSARLTLVYEMCVIFGQMDTNSAYRFLVFFVKRNLLLQVVFTNQAVHRY
jgi:hypothetical protein